MRAGLITPICLGASMNLNGQAAAAGQPDAIEAYLQPLANNHTIAGAVTLVADKDHTVYLKAVGYRDLASKDPMPTDAMFWIASTTKPMTATALMMLVDEGKVHLDDAVETYLPEFKGQMVRVEKARCGAERARSGGRGGCTGTGSGRSPHSHPRDSEPHQRAALQVGGATGRAGPVAVGGSGEVVCRGAADVSAGHGLLLFQ